jgi:hypothetical protein
MKRSQIVNLSYFLIGSSLISFALELLGYKGYKSTNDVIGFILYLLWLYNVYKIFAKQIDSKPIFSAGWLVVLMCIPILNFFAYITSTLELFNFAKLNKQFLYIYWFFSGVVVLSVINSSALTFVVGEMVYDYINIFGTLVSILGFAISCYLYFGINKKILNQI